MQFALAKKLWPPILILGIVIFLQALSVVGVLPMVDQIAEALRGILKEYGLPAVSALSFVEHLIGVNAYFPGSIVLLVSMALTAGDAIMGVMTFICIYFFALLAMHVNFLFGRIAGDRSNTSVGRSKGLLPVSAWWWFGLTFWHPHFGALTSFASGNSGMSYGRFLTYLLPTSLAWYSFWAISMYHLGQFIPFGGEMVVLVYLYILVWIALIVIRDRRI